MTQVKSLIMTGGRKSKLKVCEGKIPTEIHNALLEVCGDSVLHSTMVGFSFL